MIGCFTVRLISVAHRKETQGKYKFQYFLAQLYRRVIILYIKCGNHGAAIHFFLLSLSRFAIARTLFILWRAVLTTHFTRSDACQWCSGSVNHSPSSSVISPYSVYVVSEILCTVL